VAGQDEDAVVGHGGSRMDAPARETLVAGVIPKVHAALALDLNGEDVSAFSRGIQDAADQDGGGIELLPRAEERAGLLEVSVGIDHEDAAVEGADPDVALAVDHGRGVAERLAHAGRRPVLLARRPVDTVQVAVRGVDEDAIVRADDHGTGDVLAGDVFPEDLGLVVEFL